MRNRYIGDSLDLAKRRLLELAGQLGISTLVAPLTCQSRFQFDLYERVLGVKSPHLVHGRNAVRFSGWRRSEHLKDLAAALSGGSFQAVLLDPDSGLSRDREDDPKYLSVAEFRCLAGTAPFTSLLYHHQSAGKLRYDDVVDLLGAAGAYNFGKAALVIVGEGEQTLKLINAVSESLNPNRWMQGRRSPNPGPQPGVTAGAVPRG